MEDCGLGCRNGLCHCCIGAVCRRGRGCRSQGEQSEARPIQSRVKGCKTVTPSVQIKLGDLDCVIWCQKFILCILKEENTIKLCFILYEFLYHLREQGP